MVRRLWIAFSLLLLLTCLAATRLFLVTRSRLRGQQQAAVEDSGRRSLAAVNAMEDYLGQHRDHLSREELNHFNTLNLTANRVTAQYGAAVAAAGKPAEPPRYCRWVILLTGVLSAPGLLSWAWPRVRYTFPKPENLSQVERQAIFRKVNKDDFYHWQTYVGPVIAFVLAWSLLSACEAVLPLFSDRLPGMFFGLLPSGTGSLSAGQCSRQ